MGVQEIRSKIYSAILQVSKLTPRDDAEKTKTWVQDQRPDVIAAWDGRTNLTWLSPLSKEFRIVAVTSSKENETITAPHFVTVMNQPGSGCPGVDLHPPHTDRCGEHTRYLQYITDRYEHLPPVMALIHSHNHPPWPATQ